MQCCVVIYTLTSKKDRKTELWSYGLSDRTIELVNLCECVRACVMCHVSLSWEGGSYLTGGVDGSMLRVYCRLIDLSDRLGLRFLPRDLPVCSLPYLFIWFSVPPSACCVCF